jgi:hypothetical protein
MGKCICGEVGKDGTKDHSEVTHYFTSFGGGKVCENHVQNYVEAGWGLKKIQSKTLQLRKECICAVTGKDGTTNHSSIFTHKFPSGDGMPCLKEDAEYELPVCSNHVHSYAMLNKDYGYKVYRLEKI